MSNGWTKHWGTLQSLWRNEDLEPNSYARGLLERTVCMALVALSLLSLANFRSRSSSKNFMDVYVLVFAATLTLILLQYGFDFTFDYLKPFATILTLYRIADIAIYRAYFLLVKSLTQPWSSESIRRSVIIVAINFYETVVAFSILYCIYPVFGSSCCEKNVGHHALGAAEAIYFSLVTMLTVGYGDISPVTTMGRWMVVAQLVTTMLFVVFLLPALVGAFSPSLSSSKDDQKS